MIPLDEARRVVMEGVRRLPAVPMAPTDALGCVLAADAVAATDVPPFANSAMDGYAVRAADVVAAPVTVSVVGRVLAGATLDVAVGGGEAARIMTGAPIPEGADAVCMVERTHPADDSGEAPELARRVVIETPVGAGENVRPPGGDVRRGEIVLEAGAYLAATPVAALVSAGCASVAAIARPRVGVISTGDELVDAGQPLGPAQIYDSNRPMLAALVAEAGCVPVDLGRSPDDVGALEARITGALDRIDALVLSGGVSVGDVDVVRLVLDRLGGGAARWMQIAIRPAKPFSFTPLAGPSGPVPAFGLPGNPVSSAVGFELLVRPALRAMGGHRVTERPRRWARTAEPFSRRPDGRLHLVRVQLSPSGATPAAAGEPVGDTPARRARSGALEWLARPCAGQGSHQIRSMAVADGLALVADGDGLPAGAPVEVLVTNPACAAG